MFCTNCGQVLDEGDRFCSQCGRITLTGENAPLTPGSRRLMRDMQRKKVSGVCAGFARYLDMDVTLMRILVLTIAIFTGVGFIAYVVAWIIMPRDDRHVVRAENYSPAPPAV